jgi:hypothetical protein
VLTRVALLEGVIRAGCEASFDAHVREKLAPLWRLFPHAVRVEILREIEADEGAQHCPLVLQIAYPSRAALDEALASPIRSQSRDVTRGLKAFFEGRIFHAVYGAAENWRPATSRSQPREANDLAGRHPEADASGLVLNRQDAAI